MAGSPLRRARKNGQHGSRDAWVAEMEAARVAEIQAARAAKRENDLNPLSYTQLQKAHRLVEQAQASGDLPGGLTQRIEQVEELLRKAVYTERNWY